MARWSVLRLAFGMRTLLRDWQVGDGREAALERYVLANARQGDLDDVIGTIDRFAYEKSFLINVGDEKGALLDAAIERAKPKRLLELGTYCGYSALRTVRAAPEGAHLFSIEFNADNAAIAQSILRHAGVADRVTIVHGTLGDGKTVAKLRSEHGFTPGTLDFAFIDHAKEAYLPDIETIVRERWLRHGAIVVADNVKVPGAPEYHAFMKANEGKLFRTREHSTHLEYQRLFKDLVLESEFLGGLA
ncbi:MAG TPA: class I SAM-dependent methyltransferase [Polyangiaceae bacterium]|nr:class I SAM-dependent methyltransferase [Polyangiaceae bacterium]